MHFTILGEQDHVDLEADDIEGIRDKAKAEMGVRGLHSEKNNCWTEEL